MKRSLSTSTTPPAAVDIHAFARRTGEIIARAARALLGRRVQAVDRNQRRIGCRWAGPLLNSGKLQGTNDD